MKSIIFILLCTLWCSTFFAQETSSKNVFSFTEYIEIVKKHHPIAKQANLRAESGEATVLSAKGGFDPKLDASIRQKYFDGKQYYSYLNGGLKIPTWFGVEMYAGYNDNDGVRLNPESYNVPEGIWNAGLSVNLGKGLFIDQRRADLKQAKIVQNSTLLEKRIILNQLLRDASSAYLEWNRSFEKVQRYERNIDNIRIRLSSISQSVVLGDKPAIDTLKVKIQMQDRLLKLSQARVSLLNKRALLNTYLWQDGFIPLEINATLVPNIENTDLNATNLQEIETLVEQHPEVLIEANNLSISALSYRLKKEELKPSVNLKYNALSSNLGQGVIDDYSVNNYNWGASVSYPIFTRKERGQVKLSEIKVETQQMKLLQKKAEVTYKIQGTINQINGMREQVEIQEDALEMYQQLLDSELQLFNLGESSIFLINTRDQNLIDAELKMIDVNFNYQASKVRMIYHLMQVD